MTSCGHVRERYKPFSHFFDPPIPVDSNEYVKNRGAMFMGTGQTHLFDQYISCVKMDFLKHIFKNKFSTGLGILVTRGYSSPTDPIMPGLSDPKLSFAAFRLLNSYNCNLDKGLRLNFVLNSSLAYLTLYNKKIESDGKYIHEKIKENQFYTIEPGINLNILLFSSRRGQNNDFYLSLKTAYRHAMGTLDFGNLRQYNGFLYSLGITFDYQIF